jgi:hypothetical protein
MPTLGLGKFIRNILTSLIVTGSFAATPDIVQGMKLVRYRSASGERPGLILDGQIFDLSGSFAALNPRAPTLDDIKAIAAVPAKALAQVRKGTALGPPLRGIGKIIGVGLNYRDHAEEPACRCRKSQRCSSKRPAHSAARPTISSCRARPRASIGRSS